MTAGKLSVPNPASLSGAQVTEIGFTTHQLYKEMKFKYLLVDVTSDQDINSNFCILWFY